MMRILGIVFCGFFLWSCDDRSLAPVPQDLAYFPLYQGFYQVYDVEDRQIPFVGGEVTKFYQIKHYVADSFRNTAGGITYIIYRYKKMAADHAWQPLTTWTARRMETGAVLTEENVPFVKFSFPARAGKTWDGNAFNVRSPQIYQMDSLQKPFSYANQIYFTTATVIIENNEDFIVQLERKIEKYAPYAGMIYQEDIELNYCTAPACLGQQVVQSGRKVWYRLREYGKE
jgi:hypothetical protein